MKLRNHLLATLPLALLAASVHLPAQAGGMTLTAINADTAPTLDGVADDAAWQSATAAELSFGGGANFGGTGATTGTIKAARVGDTLYMVLQYADATHSQRRFPYAKQADGSWKKLKDPSDKGGDDNMFYEDKAALIWNIGNSIAGFESSGCFVACHAGEPTKPYGNKYTTNEGEMGDIWHIKSVRMGPVGQVDDQYLDHMRFDPKTAKGAGRHGDPKTGGGYHNVEMKDGMPEYMNQDGKASNKGGAYWLKDSEKAPFDDSGFVAGDEVAGIMVSPKQGDAADIALGLAWKDGVWTMEMARKLVTGSQYDVQFDDLKGSYDFGVAVFDNAQVRHAFINQPISLQFAQ